MRPPHVFFVWHMIATSPNEFSAAACAAFAQMEARHIAAIVEALTANELLPGRRHKAAQAVRATRLPADFAVPADWILWAQTERRWPRDVAETEALKFVDHWSAKGGKDGLKMRWEATWRNWIRGPYAPAPGNWQTSDEPVVWTDERKARALADNANFLARIGRS